jgi:hypothetical protein
MVRVKAHLGNSPHPRLLTFHPRLLTFHPRLLTLHPRLLTFDGVFPFNCKGLNPLEIEDRNIEKKRPVDNLWIRRKIWCGSLYVLTRYGADILAPFRFLANIAENMAVLPAITWGENCYAA